MVFIQRLKRSRILIYDSDNSHVQIFRDQLISLRSFVFLPLCYLLIYINTSPRSERQEDKVNEGDNSNQLVTVRMVDERPAWEKEAELVRKKI